MLSKPVAGITSLGITSEATTLQEIQTDNISLQHTVQVRKHRRLRSRRCDQDRTSHELYRTALVMA